MIARPGWCDDHADDARAAEADRQRHYNHTKRDAEAERFYHSKRWLATRAQVLAEHPTCQRCDIAWAKHVHHIKPLDQCNDWERLDPNNLRALCVPCHNIVTQDERRVPEPEPARPFVAGTLTLVEDDTYRFDAEAAERPIRFIERYCRHSEGAFAGEPFKLLPWQKERIIRPLFGWVRRDNGRRRLRELYLISAKGAGKTPLLAALALYLLLADGEASPYVVSMAATFKQARLTFDAGKAFIRECPTLEKYAEPLFQSIFTVRGSKRTGGEWTTISGRPTGRSGPRPSCIVADEIHEWPGKTAEGYELLCKNLFKRRQPLLLCATNAGASRSTFAWQLHERAVAVLTGKLDDPTLLPVIFEASPELTWDSEQAAAAANPSLGSVVEWSQLKPEVSRARQSAAAEAEYRRLYLSQWATGGAAKWLDPKRWDACTAQVDGDELAAAQLFVGLDLSQGDDLCAAVSIYTTADRWHVRSRFWLPRDTASRYQRSEGHPYQQWSADRHIDLIAETTITPAVQQRIAQAIIDQHKAHPITAVAYDRYRADAVIAALEAAGIVCVPVAQGYTLNAGCVELERRLTEGSIAIERNAVLRCHAETVEVTTDQRGNIWPVKPGRRGQFKGRPGSKIDGVVALVTAATEIQRRQVKPAAPVWSGEVLIV